MSGMARLRTAQTRHQAEHGSACEIALAPYRGERKVDLVPVCESNRQYPVQELVHVIQRVPIGLAREA